MKRLPTATLPLLFLLGACAGRRPSLENPAPPASWQTKKGRTDAQVDLTRALLESGSPGPALALIRQVREEGNDSEELEVLHARALRELGLLDDARELLVDITERHPRNAEAHGQLGILLMDSQDPAAAVSSFQRATQLSPDDPDAWNNLGFALLSQGKPEEAVVALRRALSLDATRARTRNNLGYALVAAGRKDEALRVFNAAGRPADSWYQIGLGLELGGDAPAAREAYARSVELEPGHKGARESLARLDRSATRDAPREPAPHPPDPPSPESP